MTTAVKKKGRPKGAVGTGKYGEQTIQLRVPLRLVDKVNELLKKEMKNNGNLNCTELPGRILLSNDCYYTTQAL